MNVISTPSAPAALGPYSQAIVAGGMVYCSGQIPIDPATNTIHAETIEDQTRQAITNLAHVLDAAGSGLDKVVKTMKLTGKDIPSLYKETSLGGLALDD